MAPLTGRPPCALLACTCGAHANPKLAKAAAASYPPARPRAQVSRGGGTAMDYDADKVPERIRQTIAVYQAGRALVGGKGWGLEPAASAAGRGRGRG